MHLLIFDDDERINAFVAAVARGHGWTVETAIRDTGFHALFDARRPDAIFLDLQLGASDGIEQLRFLHRGSYSGAVVLMSGFDARVLAVARQVGESLGLAIDTVIEKPARAAHVAAVLGAIARRASVPDAAGATVPDTGDDSNTDPISPSEIAVAIEAGQMELRLQPIVSAADGTVTRAEGLLRWHHPIAGMIPPDRFLPIAEQDDDVIDQLTRWVIEAAIVHYRQLRERGLDVRICVNVSGRNLRSLRFPDMVEAWLQQGGTASDAIGLEITESVATSDINATADILTRLRLKGFTLAIDDFGMGYSSLEALRRMPFSIVKVDKGFVAGLLTSGDSLTIVKSVIDLARNMGLATVAEGVETAEVADLLVDLGVGALQGYYFSPPLPFDQFIGWLREWTGRQARSPRFAGMVI
jgi:EAL domain-containing protein (putative c-di-GMP-specific phosphodiesterase class I)/ActR/RegA family two-component response regulator